MSFVEEVMTYFKAMFHQQPEGGESDTREGSNESLKYAYSHCLLITVSLYLRPQAQRPAVTELQYTDRYLSEISLALLTKANTNLGNQGKD